MRAIVGGRRRCKFELLAAVELPDNDQMREALDVGKPGFELRQYFEHAISGVLRAQTFGNVAGTLVRTTDKSMGREVNIGTAPSSY